MMAWPMPPTKRILVTRPPSESRFRSRRVRRRTVCLLMADIENQIHLATAKLLPQLPFGSRLLTRALPRGSIAAA